MSDLDYCSRSNAFFIVNISFYVLIHILANVEAGESIQKIIDFTKEVIQFKKGHFCFWAVHLLQGGKNAVPNRELLSPLLRRYFALLN